MDPITIGIIGSGIAKGVSSAVQGSQERKASKRRAKEMERETIAQLLNEAFEGGADLQEHGMGSRSRLGKRKAKSFQDTADLVRGAFRI